jgi:hypothetical protein
MQRGALVDTLGAAVTPDFSDNTVLATHASVYRYESHSAFPATWAAQKLMNSK